jgi:hypothetical protein
MTYKCISKNKTYTLGEEIAREEYNNLSDVQKLFFQPIGINDKSFQEEFSDNQEFDDGADDEDI